MFYINVSMGSKSVCCPQRNTFCIQMDTHGPTVITSVCHLDTHGTERVK